MCFLSTFYARGWPSINNEDSSRLSEGNVLAAKKPKGNLKWQGDYNELCQFVDDLQLQPGS